MESTKQIRSIRSIRGQKKQTYSLPFREGLGVGFFPSPSEHRERLTSTKHTAWGGDDEGEGEQCARGG